MRYSHLREPVLTSALSGWSTGAPKKVLIVDDQEELRKLVRMTMDLGNYLLYEAEDGQQGLDMVAMVQPDIVILDVMMPGSVDGYQVCQSIKSHEKTRSTYVILLTARGQKSDIQKGEKAGADAYLVKPFSPLELIDIVKKG